MSQQSDSSSPKKLSLADAPNSVPRTEPVNPNQVLDVAPLRIVGVDDLKIKKSRTPHARRPKEYVQTKDANPSLSTSRANLPKEGSKYVHEAITKIVTRILDEQHQVPEISVPLQTVIPEPVAVTRANIIGKSSNDDDVHIVDDDVHTSDGDVQMNEEEESDDDVPKDNDNEDVTENVNDIGNIGADVGTGTAIRTCIHVVDLDDYSDNDLVAVVNPGIAKRLMTRKKGLIKSRDVSQSVSIGPTKSWSKVIPKKRKAQAIVDSDSDVDVDAQDIPLSKKLTTSNLGASVPEVPIDNISFHYPSSVNRWKYVHHNRLALEMELAQNVLENKEIMDLIHEAGLLKTVVHLPTCYEMLVKESDEAQHELEVTDNKICEVISAKQVKAWPLKGKLSASKLSIKYAMLHKIGAANWVPTNHQSTIANVLGKFIYDVGTKTNTPNILSESDVVCKREITLSFHYKLFQGTHVPDIVTTSAGTSKDNTHTGKATVITMLRETCKELESRKLTLEKLISSLDMEEGVDFVENEVGPAEDEEEEEAGQDDGTYE
ncbi:uncharacterized protein LOC131628912 [Vicia villosa]|uniref:uncharacterized protein LOC131628912 n=1 Tax=Vicia villosa TaxID=3911 RepID=UPI00273AF21D|nr:uncharacterized protein LOC131628912 [Vicia villosa]